MTFLNLETPDRLAHEKYKQVVINRFFQDTLMREQDKFKKLLPGDFFQLIVDLI